MTKKRAILGSLDNLAGIIWGPAVHIEATMWFSGLSSAQTQAAKKKMDVRVCVCACGGECGLHTKCSMASQELRTAVSASAALTISRVGTRPS